MKVLMIGPARSVNGGISAVVNNYYKAGLDQRVQLQYIGTMEDGSKLYKLMVAIKAMMQYVLTVSKYDLVHINMASDVSLYRKIPFIVFTKLFGKKLVIHQHGGNIKQFYYEECNEKRRNFIKKVLRKADAFVVVAPFLKDIFKDIVEEEKIVVLPNAIEIPVEICKDYQKQDLLFLGRLCKEKGIYELLDAVKELKSEFPALQLYLGGVWVEEELERRAEECDGYVHYLGWIDKEEKNKYLKQCNLFVLPTYFEGLPISLLEGMAYGCACVASEVGGIPQVMTHDVDGILIPAKDKKALKAAIRKLLKDISLQRELSINARKRVEECYDIKKSIQKLVTIYNGI